MGSKQSTESLVTAKLIINETLQELNTQVDVDGESPNVIAEAYLQGGGVTE